MKHISLFVIALASSAQAQLTTLQKQALSTHPMVKVAEAEAQALRARGQVAKAPFKPMISLTGVGAIGDDSAIFATASEPRNYLFSPHDPIGIGSVMAMWTIFSGGRNRSAATYAASTAAEGEARVATARLDVLREVRVNYAQLDSAVGDLAAKSAGVQAAEELLRVTVARFTAGSAPEAFVLTAKANLARALRMRAMAEAEANAASAMLREAIGLSPGETLVRGEWDVEMAAPSSLDEALALAEARPELAQLQARSRSAASLARSARQSAYPELNLVGMGTGMATENESDVFYKVGLVLSIPLVDGGMRKSEASENEAMARAAEQETKMIRLRVHREVASAWAQWQSAPETLRASDAEVSAAQEAYRIAKLRYEEGKAPQVEVEQATADLVEALAGRAESIAFRRIAWANLMRAVGISPDQEDPIK